MARAALFLVLAVLVAGCQSYVLTVGNPSSNLGTVTGGGINCGSICTAQIASGTSVTLAATAASGSIFDGWFGCDTVLGSACTLTMDRDRAVGVRFGPPITRTYPLIVVKRGSGSGTVAQPGTGPSTPPGLGIYCGTNCSAHFPAGSYTLVATAASGSAFDGWSGCNTVSGNTCTVNVLPSQSALGFPPSYSVSATFTASNYTLSVAKTGTGSGTVSGNGINCGSTCQTALPVGTLATLTALATSGSTFAGWTGCDSVSGSTCSLTLGGSRTVSAMFNQSTTAASVTLYPTHTNGLLSSTVDASKANTTYPNQATLPIGCAWEFYSQPTPYSDVVCSRALMIFDLGSLSGHVITHATLSLPVVEFDYVNPPGDPWDMLILTTAWNPNTVTWNNTVMLTGNYYTPAPNGLPPLGTGTVTFDLTATVADWVAHPSDNHGFALTATSMSSPNATASDVFVVGGIGAPPASRPTLVVQYQ